jgi:hypothetical protein
MANRRDIDNQNKLNDLTGKQSELLSDQAHQVEILRREFRQLGREIKDSIEEAIDATDDLSSSTEKLAKSGLREIEGSVKKIGKTLEDNVEIQYRINQGQDQSKRIADQLVKIETRHAITTAQIQNDTELTEDTKKELLKLADKQFNKAKLLNEELEDANTELLESKTLIDVGKEGLEGWAKKLDKSGVLAGILGGKMSKAGMVAKVAEASVISLFKDYEKGFKTINKQTTDLQNAFGFTLKEAVKLNVEFRHMSQFFKGNAILAQDVQKAFADINGQLGLASTTFSKGLLPQVADLQKRMGVSSEAAHNFAKQSMITGQEVDNIVKSQISGLLAAEEEHGVRIAIASAIKEAAETTGEIRANLGYSIENITAAIGRARQFGMTLQDLANISDNLLNFQSSIEAELQAELFTGKQLNLEKARLLALTGDYVGLAEEIKKQVGGEYEFARMNVLEKRKYAAALGMSVDRMSDLVYDQEYLAQLSEKQRDATEEEIYQSLKRQDIQTQFADLLLRVQEIIVNIAAGPLGHIAGWFTGLLESTGGLVLALGIISGFKFFGLIRGVKMLVGWLTAGSVAATTLYGILTLGIALAVIAAVVAAAKAQGKHVSSVVKGQKNISDGFQKEGIVYSKPKGSMSVMLDKDDEMIAGTDLGLDKASKGANAAGIAGASIQILIKEMVNLKKEVKAMNNQSKDNTQKIVENDTVTLQSGWGSKTKFT